tara:strand:+ start:388 stop:864 length:477 start_codon:yes stop_codon:yes gene_type:complete
MKKIFFCAVILFLFFSFLSKSSFAQIKWGNGDIKISQKAFNQFFVYLQGTNYARPLYFLITTDGQNGYWWWCPGISDVTCEIEHPIEALKTHFPLSSSSAINKCELYYKGKKCKFFAIKRIIKWRNSNIFGKDKNFQISSNLSKYEVKQRLIKLGFIN